MTPLYKGDNHLIKLLNGAGDRKSWVQVELAMDGILAAPEDLHDHLSWMKLFTIGTNPELRDQLWAYKEKRANEQRVPMPDILMKLQNELKRMKQGGFYVPLTDEFRGEYLPERTRRLFWLTGFTGSAGEAIVLEDKAAFFTDGRYTLQAREQLKGKNIEIYSTAKDQGQTPTMKPLDWLKKNLPPQSTFVIDPWLHTPAEVREIEAAVRAAGSKVAFAKSNPIDDEWRHHPHEPFSPVVPHPAEFSGKTTKEKLWILTAALDCNDTDAIILTKPEDVCWLMNIRGNDVPNTPLCLSYAIVHKSGEIDWYVNSFKLTEDFKPWAEEIATVHFFAVGLRDIFEKEVKKLVKDGKRIWVDPKQTPFAIEDAILDTVTKQDARDCEQDDEAEEDLRERLEGPMLEAKLQELYDKERQRESNKRRSRIHYETNPVQRLKAIKNETEIKGAIAAHLRDGAAVTRFLAAMAEQGAAAKYTELSATELLLKYRQENENFRGLSFDTIAGAGPHGAIIHYRSTEASNTPLTVSPMFLVDSGAQYLDGTTDITRTISVDTPTEEMRDRFTRVLKGHIQIAMSVFPEGTTGKDIDNKARAPLAEVVVDGRELGYSHGTGHGVGSYLSVHEGPQGISAGAVAPFEPGMIVSNEPGYYKEGEYGIRNENLVLVIDTGKKDGENRRLLGFKTISLAPFDRNLIEPSLMDDAELKWLNDYHAEVKKQLLPLLAAKNDTRAVSYLTEATAPIKRPAPPGNHRTMTFLL